MLTGSELEDRARQCEQLAAMYSDEPASAQLHALAVEFRAQIVVQQAYVDSWKQAAA